MEIILASQSPRRQELLRMVGLKCRTVVSDADENIQKDMPPTAFVKKLALLKAQAVYGHHQDACVIGVDTIVCIDGMIIGKPEDNKDAFRILKTLSGRTHTVYSGIAVLTKQGADVRHETTRVTFNPMSDQEIAWYIQTGEPRDKAGAYGIQGPGGIFVKKISGNYFNVIGLPLPLLYAMLQKANIQVFANE